MPRRIKAIRQFVGDTQAEFAQRIGLAEGSQSEIAKWERGVDEPPHHRQKAIASLVGADFKALHVDDHPFCHGVRFGAKAVLKLVGEGYLTAFWDRDSQESLQTPTPEDGTAERLGGTESGEAPNG